MSGYNVFLSKIEYFSEIKERSRLNSLDLF